MLLELSENRHKWIKEMVGEQIPRLWCPPLTHYNSEGKIDLDHMTAHWDFMIAYVNSFLIPGSTGDAWEMTEKEVFGLLELALDLAGKRDIRFLLGVLKKDAATTRAGIFQMLSLLKKRTGESDSIKAMKASKVCGFTICPPRGKKLTQDEIENDLNSVLKLGFPTVLYQLPQVTENEMSPSLVEHLTERHPNLILFKDSSGTDRVALENGQRSGLFLTRGAEGGYAQWLKESGGPYHGLLLSTANCFPDKLKKIINCLETRRLEEAADLSKHLTRVVEKIFNLVSDLPQGNVFSNANKAMDHFMAFGPDAPLGQSPRLHGGMFIPNKVMIGVRNILEAAQLIPYQGYMN
jgi:dihydrodipicolinate synthase/N-acetylneuraminate lyase